MIITPDVARRARLAARCPHCHAPVGARCVVLSRGRPLTGHATHPARVAAAAQATTGQGSAA